jgi:hypothetical protein
MAGQFQSELKHLNDITLAGTLLGGERYNYNHPVFACLSVTTLQGYTFRTDAGNLWEMFSSVYAQSSVGSSQICTLLVFLRFHNF